MTNKSLIHGIVHDSGSETLGFLGLSRRPERDDWKPTSNQQPQLFWGSGSIEVGMGWAMGIQWVMLHHSDGRSGIDSGMTLTQDLPVPFGYD